VVYGALDSPAHDRSATLRVYVTSTVGLLPWY
jgi:hypothetical protein